MPPCAATVWDLVGNTFETTATSNPDFDISREALKPEPPPPMIATSKIFSDTVIPPISIINFTYI